MYVKLYNNTIVYILFNKCNIFFVLCTTHNLPGTYSKLRRQDYLTH